MPTCMNPTTARAIDDAAKIAKIPVEELLRQRGYPPEGVAQVSKLVRNTLNTPTQQAITSIRATNTKLRDTPKTRAKMRDSVRNMLAAGGYLDVKKVKSKGRTFGSISINEQIKMVKELGADATNMKPTEVRKILKDAGLIGGETVVRKYRSGVENIIESAVGRKVTGEIDAFMRSLSVAELAAVRDKLLSGYMVKGDVVISQKKGAPPITNRDIAVIAKLRGYEGGKLPASIKNLRDVFEPAPRLFERLEKIAPGIKDAIFRPYQDKQSLYLMRNAEHQHYLKTVRKTLAITEDGSRNIAIDGLWDNPEAQVSLKAMGINERPKLSTYERLAQRIIKEEFYEPLFRQLNTARASMGLDPILYEPDYMPMMRDMGLAKEGGYDIAKIDSTSFTKNRKAISQVNTRHAISRVKESDLPIKLDAFAIASQYTNSVLRASTMGPITAHIESMFRTKVDVAKVVKKHGPNVVPSEIAQMKTFSGEFAVPEAYKAISTWLNHANGIRVDSNGVGAAFFKALDPYAKWVNRNLAVGFLGGSIQFFLVQPTVLARAWGQLGFFGGPVWLLRGMGKVIADYINAPPGTRTGELRHLRGYKRESSVLTTRAMDTFVEDTYALAQAGLAGKLKAGWRSIGDASINFGKVLDEVSANITYAAARLYGEKKLKLQGKELVDFADDITLYTNASGAAMHRAPIQHTPTGRMFTLFQTFLINDFFYFTRQIGGAKKYGLTPSAAKSVLRAMTTYAVTTAIVNSMYESVGLNAPFPAPISEFNKALNERGKSTPQAALAAATEFAQILPGIGGTVRFGGSVGGAAMEYTTEAFRVATGRPTQRPWWVILGRLGGVPGTAPAYQLYRAEKKEQSRGGGRGMPSR